MTLDDLVNYRPYWKRLLLLPRASYDFYRVMSGNGWGKVLSAKMAMTYFLRIARR